VSSLDLPAAPNLIAELSSIQVFPSADVLPENLLRFHLRFSRVPDVFDVNEDLRLVDGSAAAKKTVAHPFLDLSEGLWSADGLTLTVLLHPGRIKSGLASYEALGAAIQNTRRYELQMRVNAVLGEVVAANCEWFTLKRFSVTQAFTHSIDANAFVVTPPRADTRSPLVIELGHIADRLAVENFLAITDDENAIIPADIDTSDSETTIQIRPQTTWRVGTYAIHFGSEFEDVSGNRFGAPFESNAAGTFEQQTTRLLVSIANN
jgi:hypothetical protein